MGARRARVAQALMMQAGLAVILVFMAWISRADARSSALYLATLVVPAGWTYAFWTGHRREEAARTAGRWNAEISKKERSRAFAILGAAIGLWVLLAIALIYAL